MQLNDDDLLHEHWWTIGREHCRRCTHIPTGISVSISGAKTMPVQQILVELRNQLATKIAAHFGQQQIDRNK
jgi:hypothetical protein